jgi:hypothetical protein
MRASTDNRIQLSLNLERGRIIPVPQAAEIMGVSADTFRRHYGHLIRKLSPRRNGVRLGDVIDAELESAT